jgi:3-phenylpropionate/trans-cinnamate dioxygenase ferredoxin reductase subunit
MHTKRAVVIGGSHAGAQLCASLRQEGWAGEIVLISDESCLPYHRPPLSKTFLADTASISDLLIRAPTFYEKQYIDVRFAQVTAINRLTKTLRLSDGSDLHYDKLALCLGARPRQLMLPGAELAGVHYLRNANDVMAIKRELAAVSHAVIIGGGYIGLETAASLRALGVAVTVLESAERVLQRVTAAEVSAFYARVHAEEGVTLRTGVVLLEILGGERVTGVRCASGGASSGASSGADGEASPGASGGIMAADMVIIGIGVLPNTELAEAAGLSVDNGISIDAQCLTNDPDIVAAGDCANHFSAAYGRRVRLESVPNAGEQAKVAAATLCGKPKVLQALPWFWSDQFNIKLQIAGLNQGHNRVVFRGDHRAGRGFACFYFIDNRLIATDCINRPQEFMFSQKAIADQLALDPVKLADEHTPLTECLR